MSLLSTKCPPQPSHPVRAIGRDDELERFESRGDWLFETIGEEIVSGRMPPGVKLGEEALARRFGTSRGPLREAIRRLEERRLVTRIPNAGTRVRSFSTRDFVEFFEVREVLEGLAARLAATHMDWNDLAELRGCFDDHRRLVDAGDPTARDRDVDFHHRLAQASHNEMLICLLCRDFYSLFRICRRQYGRAPGREQRVLVEHRRLLEALEDRDPDLAELLVRRHIRSARKGFRIASAGDPADPLARPADEPIPDLSSGHPCTMAGSPRTEDEP